ncbi:MAG: hypothetical protein MJE77_32855 [Proteobacteria bacterium]|nr:hypothetical protein [Pseudomonadota bacterium]
MALRWLCSTIAAVSWLVAASGQPAWADGTSIGAEKGAFGLGLILGEPTGISAKLYLDDSTAVDGAAGVAIIGGGLHVHGDYLWHPWVLEERDMFVLPAYVGVGGRLFQRDRSGGDSDFHIGARAVGGMLFDFKELPLDVFVEIAGVVDYVFSDIAEDEGIGLALNLGVGARYYF